MEALIDGKNLGCTGWVICVDLVCQRVGKQTRHLIMWVIKQTKSRREGRGKDRRWEDRQEGEEKSDCQETALHCKHDGGWVSRKQVSITGNHSRTQLEMSTNLITVHVCMSDCSSCISFIMHKKWGNLCKLGKPVDFLLQPQNKQKKKSPLNHNLKSALISCLAYFRSQRMQACLQIHSDRNPMEFEDMFKKQVSSFCGCA